jgi:hypothetical protein
MGNALDKCASCGRAHAGGITFPCKVTGGGTAVANGSFSFITQKR